MTSQPSHNKNGLRGGATVCADSHRNNKEKNMGANHSTPRRPLKPFTHFLPERLRGIRRGKATDETLKEETLEGTIKGGSAIVIGSTVTDDERATAIDGFVEDINDMDGEKVFAIAVAFD
jgi:hypothetical protein